MQTSQRRSGRWQQQKANIPGDFYFRHANSTSNRNERRASGLRPWLPFWVVAEYLISGGHDRGFPGIQGCGYLIQLFDQLILAELLQLTGFVLDFRRKLVGPGTDLRKRFFLHFVSDRAIRWLHPQSGHGLLPAIGVPIAAWLLLRPDRRSAGRRISQNGLLLNVRFSIFVAICFLLD